VIRKSDKQKVDLGGQLVAFGSCFWERFRFAFGQFSYFFGCDLSLATVSLHTAYSIPEFTINFETLVTRKDLEKRKTKSVQIWSGT
jgi:hypothetical protein